MSSKLDTNKLSYDLALIYAKSKFDEYLRNSDTEIDTGFPVYYSEADILMKLFSDAYNEYLGYDEGDFEEKSLDIF